MIWTAGICCAANQPSVSVSIPSLCYHQILPTAKGLYETSTADFRKQLDFLKSSQFQSINSDDLLIILSGKSGNVKKPILLTFDDGYVSVFTQALPIMREYGFVGVACIYPEFIGSGGGMSWKQLKQLQEEGWSVECHTMSHADIAKGSIDPKLRDAFFEKEIARSRHIIDEHLNHPVKFIVWPYGIYTEASEAFARSIGYLGALTVDGGASFPGLDPFRIKRQVVYRTDTMEKFQIRVEMEGLQLEQPSPAPGTIVSALREISCTLPALNDYTPEKYVLNVKITGGKATATFDPATHQIHAIVSDGNLKSGQHFIDVYLRDNATGLTAQNGWLFTIRR
ncbi:MAG: polysaccharide deacetylase family protein [Candidatus Riflebacteria bacterium]|nr:polysaccharide deacetylase family protein [Candidatus Riflebacteria bacterium]